MIKRVTEDYFFILMLKVYDVLLLMFCFSFCLETKRNKKFKAVRKKAKNLYEGLK
jgi:hypothetical protein